MMEESTLEERLSDVRHVYLEFCDLNGLSRSKQVTADYFLETWQNGFPVNMLLLVQTPRNHVPTGTGYGEEIGYGDGLLRPDLVTMKALPWRDSAVRVLCDIEFEGELVGALPRTALQSVVSDIDLDLEFGVGSELEFYLLDTDDRYDPVTDHKHEWISWATEQITPFHDRLAEWSAGYDIPIQSLEHEHGPGQFEVLFDYGLPVAQADRTFDFKRVVKQAATHTGHTATFMAKPFSETSGNGYHLHVSAVRDEKNAFTTTTGELSETGRAFIAGILDHVDALTAIHAPTLNAYKRFDPDGFAPDTASWGFDNRLASIRIPSGTTRIENRIGSADANPYLVIASTLAAGVDGIRRSLEPREACDAAPTGDSPKLPRSLNVALSALEADDVLIDSLGEELVTAYVASKRRGLAAFRDDVTDWERDQFLELL